MVCTTGYSEGDGLIRLTPIDRNYLHMETGRRPMHWSLAIRLETTSSPISVDEVRARVRERSKHFGVFRLGVRHGQWRRPKETAAADWDARTHVHALDVDDEGGQLAAITGLLESRVVGPDPMWDVTLITRRDSGEQLILLRVHHCVSDGIAGAAFAALVADGDPAALAEFDRFATSNRFQFQQPAPEAVRMARSALLDQWRTGQQKPRWPRLTGSGRREIALYSASTREIRRSALAHGVSVQEYLMAIVGQVVSVTPPNSRRAPRVRVALPVTLDADMRHTGNAVAVGLITLFGNEPDLAKQLANVRSELDTLDRRRPELALPALTQAGQRLPWTLQRLAAKVTMRVLHPDLNVGVSPSYSSIRSIHGHRMVDLVPLSPLAGYSLSVSILLLGDRTTFGVVADARALPGYAKSFAGQLERSLKEVSDHEAVAHQPA